MHSTITLRLLAAAAAFSVAFPAVAAPMEEDVARLVVRGDLYVAGGLVDVTERVEGDLIAAGGTVTIEGGVTGDLLVTGGQIEVRGPVRDDVRIAGGTVRVRGTIGGDLVIFGGDIVVDDGSAIVGDVVLMGGTVRMEGVVSGNLRIEAGEAVVSGEVKGNAYLRGENIQLRDRVLGNATLIAENFTSTPQGRIEGKLDYWVSGGQRNFGQTAAGGATYRADLEPYSMELEQPAIAAAGLGLLGFGLWSVLSGALFIILAMLITRTHFQAAGKYLRKKPWTSLWQGFLAIVLTPVLAFLLCFTIIGIPLGIFVLMLYIFLFVFLKAIAALVVARALEDYWGCKWSFWIAFLWTVLVYVVLKVLMIVPVAGWLIVAMVCVAAIGADNTTKLGRLKKIR